MKNLKKDQIKKDIRDCGYKKEEIVIINSKKYKNTLVKSSLLPKEL